jgi:hypothetical protein
VNPDDDYYLAAPTGIPAGRSAQRRVPTVVVRGPGRVGEELAAERVDGSIVRLTWNDGSDGVQEVSLFVADAEQKVLAAQTVRAAPFTALFDLAPGTAYVGVTLLHQDGVKSTTLVPSHLIRTSADLTTPSALPPPEPLYTGLIVDARALNLQRAMGPRILDTTGQVLYPDASHVPEIDFLQEHGMASYVTEAGQARRSGPHPLILPALAVAGPGRDDLVVSREAAARILAANRRGRFLERWAVSILVTPR